LAVEYTGYGLFHGDRNSDLILSDCLSVFDYLTEHIGVQRQDIILLGWSIGSSPACYIAKERPEVGALLLISPFKSLREVARDHVGKLLSYILAERYRNVDLIREVYCPILIIHGLNDKMINIDHSYTLKQNCQNAACCTLHTPENMDHNNFNLQEDLIIPMK